MDSTFFLITITFIIFLIIAYYLKVIRFSTPLVMIYFIYCFGYFINYEKTKDPNEGLIKNIESVNKHNENKTIKKLKNISNNNANFTPKENDYKIEPKPIVSSLPKPIVIDSNLVASKNKNIKEISSESSAILDGISEEDSKEDKNNMLKLNEIMICRGIYKRNPIKPGVKFINNVDSLFCYTKISNSGSKQEVKHVWYYENKEITTVSYNIKTSYNYRSWSKKTIYPNQTGNWRVDVISKSGNLLGSRDFTINSINNSY